MLESNIKCRYLRVEKDRFCQGDILKDVSITLGLSDTEIEGQEMNNFDLPYCVVMNQDCDLKWDFELRKDSENNDKQLPTILVCPAYLDESFYAGTHIESWHMRKFDSKTLVDKLKNNDEINRCHFLKGDSLLQVPNLVVDFKHFYTIPRDLLYAVHDKVYLVTINELFRERLSQRFANYLSRFGLPDLKD